MPLDKGQSQLVTQIVPPSNESSVVCANAGQVRLRNTIKAHADSVACVAAHPAGDAIASAADDATFRVWSMPGCARGV